MSEPTPRQQAGYLRRLLRRGVLQVIDPRTGEPLPTNVELDGPMIRLVPVLEPFPAAIDVEQARWSELLDRLRKRLTLAETEALVTAVEAELQSPPARSYMPQST
jgi:hypothetical protein